MPSLHSNASPRGSSPIGGDQSPLRDDFPLRNERGIIHIIAVVLVLGTIFQFIVLQSMWNQIDSLETELANTRHRVETLEHRVQTLETLQTGHA